MIRVASIWKHHRRDDEERVYVGRACRGYPASPLGNPFKGPGAVSSYEEWLRGQVASRSPEVVQELLRLARMTLQGDVTLLCWCAKTSEGLEPDGPLECHAQIVGRVVRKLADNLS